VIQTRGAGFGLLVILLVLFCALAANVIAPYNPSQIQPVGILSPPSPQYLLGTDAIGRDVLSRIIYGTRVSLAAGAVSVGVALSLGVLIGLLAGYHGGWIDDVLMRMIDALYSFPALLLALAITAILGPGLTNVMLAIGIVFTPAFARLVRGQALSVRECDFVMAARVIGAQPWRIMSVHIWPNVTAPIVVQASLQVAAAIVIEAGLSYLARRPAAQAQLRHAQGRLPVHGAGAVARLCARRRHVRHGTRFQPVRRWSAARARPSPPRCRLTMRSAKSLTRAGPGSCRRGFAPPCDTR
jgi:peptide/nickel transport system permease protein